MSEPTTEIALLPLAVSDLTTVYSTKAKIDEVLTAIEVKARAFVPDLSTDTSRKQIASMAHQVARSKKALEDAAMRLTDEWRMNTAAVNAEKKRVIERLDALKAEVRKPLTEWEVAEASRVEALEARYEALIREAEEARKAQEEQARIATERAAQREREMAERRAAEMKEAEERAAEQARQAAERKAAEELAAARAETERVKRQAAEAEQRRTEEEAAEKAALAARLADEAHRVSIQVEIQNAISELTEDILEEEDAAPVEVALLLTLALMRGEIPHVEVRF